MNYKKKLKNINKRTNKRFAIQMQYSEWRKIFFFKNN